jgi:hypothetical protein
VSRFSNKEKAAECRREHAQRVHVYARRISEGKMKQADADRKIALVLDMAADYDALDAQDRPDLFGAADPARRDNAIALARTLRELVKFGETPRRAETIRKAADLLEDFARV